MINKGTWCARGRPGIFLHLHLLPNGRRLAKSMNLEKTNTKRQKDNRWRLAKSMNLKNQHHPFFRFSLILSVERPNQPLPHPFFNSYFQDDAGSPCAGLAVCGCLDLPPRPFHTLSSSVWPGFDSIEHNTLLWEYPVVEVLVYFCSGLHIFGKSREHNQEPCSCLYRSSRGDQVGSRIQFMRKISSPLWILVDQIILPRFHPAHMLKDPGMERKGRLWHLNQSLRNPYKFAASFSRPCWAL